MSKPHVKSSTRQKPATTKKAASTAPKVPRRPAAETTGMFAELFARSRSADFQNWLRSLLLELCRIDTTLKMDPAQMREAEGRCFAILERELAGLNFPGATLERRPINPAINQHPHFSLLHFTKTAERPEGLPAETVYAGRSNLVWLARGSAGNADPGRSVALNAHVDVVAPYFPPGAAGTTVHGRGACDDKGPVVSIVGALKLLSEWMTTRGMKLNRNVVAMFVVEEETGGNGSLSLALDRELKGLYDSVLVGECTGLKLHPANRGAVWYRAELKPAAGISPLELFAFVNEELEKEGAALRAESRHRLFPQRPVQTCHGVIGPYGEHPSRICGEVVFAVRFPAEPSAVAVQLLEDCLESGLAGYIGLYGDKTKVTDAATGRPMVARHYELKKADHGFEITVHGATGHMGAIRERDGAITKLAHLVRALVFSKRKLDESAGGPVRLELCNHPSGDPLVLEGGQGFVPTHGIDEVMARLREAARRGAENYLRRAGRKERGAEVVQVTYEKLHNVAFDGDLASLPMQSALAAAKACGLPQDDPVVGWTVSCDARLFASEYPGLPVLTFGPGQLAFAHSNQEQIDMEEVRKAAEFYALFLLAETGSGGERPSPGAAACD